MINAFDRALKDKLFIRILYLAWSFPFAFLAVWGIELAESEPVLLVLPTASGLMFAILLYISVKTNETTTEDFQAISGGFWFLLIFSVIVLYPIWFILKKGKTS